MTTELKRYRRLVAEISRLTVDLPKTRYAALKSAASASGRTVSAFVDEMIGRELAAKAAQEPVLKETTT